MRIYTIAPVPSISIKAIATVFMGTFGSVWLFVEPLGMFGIAPSVEGGTGVVLYFALLGIALIGTSIFVKSYRWHKAHKIPFIKLNVVSASDGATY